MAAGLSGLDPDLLEFNDPPQIIWILVQDAINLTWRDNPKLHDIGGISSSIQKHGYKEPAIFSSELFRAGQPETDEIAQGAFCAGNGRMETLTKMELMGADLPRGMATVSETGAWVVWIVTGTDAKSRALAESYAIDSNLLMMAGGGLSPIEMARVWSETEYLRLLRQLAATEAFPIAMDRDDLDVLGEVLEPEPLEFGDFADDYVDAPPEELLPRIRLQLEMIAIADLQADKRNYQTHPEDQIRHLIKSLSEHGLYKNVVVSRDGVVLAGHGIMEALTRMGVKHVPVARLDVDSEDPRALKVLTGDNQSARLGNIDDRALSEVLKDIKLSDVTLLGTGFDEMMLANLVYVTRPLEEVQDFDIAAHWVGMPEYQRTPKPPKVMVLFRSLEDRDDFGKMIGASFTGKTNSTWWPVKEIDDVSSMRFVTSVPDDDGTDFIENEADDE